MLVQRSQGVFEIQKQAMFPWEGSRLLELTWPAFMLVHDLDGTRKAKYGAYYNQKNPPTEGVPKDRVPGI